MEQTFLVTRRDFIEPESLPEAIKLVDSIELLPAEGCLFVILDFQHEHDHQLIYQLRKIPGYELLPVFYLGKPPPYSEQILDGSFGEDSMKKALAIQERSMLVQATKNKELSIENLIARYMYVREGFKLRGYLNFHYTAGFHYPLIDILTTPYNQNNEDEHQVWYILQSMTAHNYLQSEQLIDELQICPFCTSGLLNFKNCCPNCSSINIEIQPFVHCFACGNIGPMSEFLRNNELICRRCNTKLRHIGIDYDKPLEDKTCRDCKFCFFEAVVKSVCLVCARLFLPEELQVRKLYQYELTFHGEALARNEVDDLVIELNQFLTTIDLSIFRMIVKWQTLVVKRYRATFFNLVAIKIKNQDELISKNGIIKTEKIFAEFFHRIRELTRDTDLVTIDNKTIIFYLPMTPGEHCHIVFKRIKDFTDIQWSNGTHIELALGCLSSQEIQEKNIDDNFLLAELYNQVGGYD